MIPMFDFFHGFLAPAQLTALGPELLFTGQHTLTEIFSKVMQDTREAEIFPGLSETLVWTVQCVGFHRLLR